MLTGEAKDAGKGAVIIETEGGVGYIVNMLKTEKNTTLSQKKSTIFTHTAIRQDTMELFGFLEQEEYSSFLLLLTVSGIGPKKALGILETTPPNTLLSAIKREDVGTLTSFGMGKKQAQRIILDLQKKIEIAEESEADGDIIAALVALGYDKKEIAQALKETHLKGKDIKEQIQEALKAMRNSKR